MAKSSFFKDGGGGSTVSATIQSQVDAAAASAAAAANSFNSIGNELTLAQAARAGSETARDASIAAQTSSESARDTAIQQASNASTSASNASTSEANAQTSENNSSSSASAAAASAQNASTSEGNASTSATASQTAQTASETARDASVVARTASETAKTASEAAQTASETARDASVVARTASETAKTASEAARDLALSYRNTAETHKNDATTQAGIATTQAGTATTQAGNASASATSAASAQAAAESARDSALAAFDSFDDRYLGAKTTTGGDPTQDNDGNSLVAGALFFDSTNSVMKLYTGSAWVAAYVSGGSFASLSGATFTGDVTVPNLITSGNVDGRDVSVDGAKLDGIAANATAVTSLTDLNITDGTNGQVLTTNGSGSFSFADAAGADADTLDGLDSTSFLRSDASDTMTGDLSVTGSVSVTSGASDGITISHDDFGEALRIIRNDANNAPSVTFENTSGRVGILWAQASNTALRWRPGTGTTDYDVWHTGNDGSGSGLDADTLDGYHGSFTRNQANSYVLRDSNGYMQVGWINTTSGETTNTINKIYASNDDYVRYITPATFRDQVISNQTINEIYNNGWYRTYGQKGWYNQTYGGGIYMADSTYVRTYGSKQLYVNTHIKAASNVYAYWSDDRLKTKIGNIDNALDKVQRLSGFTYTRNDVAKSHGFDGDEVEVGVSAQQVKAVLPQAIHLAPFDEKVEDDGTIVSKSGENYMTVDYPRLVPLLIEAIKELKAEVDELKAGCCHASSD